MYRVTDKCMLCRYPYACIYNCPANAIFNNGNHAEIDQTKCVQCGKCYQLCNLCAIENTELAVKPAEQHEPLTKDCDILILGGGASGLIAALRAYELCGAKVIVVEKAKKPGGCGIYASSLRLFGTQWEKEHGIPDHMDDLIRAAFHTTRGLLNIQLIANNFKALPRFFDWFCEWGDPEEGFIFTDEPGPNGTYIQPKVRDNGGHYLMTKIIEKIRTTPIELLTETQARKFIMKDGRVQGVVASDPGGEITITAKCTLVAMGNIGNNQKLLDKYVPEYARAYKRPTMHLLPSCTGDFVEMAEQAGIPIDEKSIVPAYLGPMNSLYNMQTMMQPARSDVLNVNLNGKRWKSECYRGEACNALMLQQPQSVSWVVMDTPIACATPVPPTPVLYDSTFGRNISNGIPKENGEPSSPANMINLGPAGGLPVQPGATSEGIIADIEKVVSIPGKYAVKGNTLEELAEEMGVPVDEFVTTVQRYNDLCRKGHDDDFFKPAQYLLPIEQGPFYAFHCHMGTDGVFGGFYVNENQNVIGKDGPIDGLYAAGDNTGGRYINQGGEKKQIINDFAYAVSSGMIAGENMVSYLANH